MVTALLAGDRNPSDPALDRLAAVLGFLPEFFGGDDLPEPSVEGTSFRALSNMSAKKRDEAFSSASIGMMLYEWIDERFVLPQVDVPRYQGLDAETAALGLRSHWGLGERPIRNILDLLEAHGARVLSIPEDCLEIDAFSERHSGQLYVFLNTRKSTEHSRMDASHELGHLVMHSKGRARGREAEREAAQFGSAFLMPASSVLSQIARTTGLQQIIRAKSIWGVSAAALTYRMHNLGMLSDWQYRTLFKQLSVKGYRTDEPNGMKPESSQVLAKVFSALETEGVSKADVARELSLGEHDLDEVTFGLVGLTSVPNTGSRHQTSERNEEHRPQLRIVR